MMLRAKRATADLCPLIVANVSLVLSEMELLVMVCICDAAQAGAQTQT